MDAPEPLLRLLPELAALPVPHEPLASCATCAMAPVPGAPAAVNATRVFTARARCCTYHPRLANFLAGRALRRGGTSERLVRARLADPDGVGPLGVESGVVRGGRLRGRSDDDFGRNEALTCPYWVDGPLGCGIHPDRDAVCRTWHCKVVNGLRGQEAWNGASVLLSHAELLLAERCRDALPFDPADPAAMYVAAADLVDALPDDALRALRTARTEALVAMAQRRARDRDAAMPDVLVTRIRDVEVRDAAHPEPGVVLTSFSPYDPVVAPPWIFRLLARFDGARPWREACDLAAREDGLVVPPDLVPWLWWRGLLGPPEDLVGPDEPVVTVLPA